MTLLVAELKGSRGGTIGGDNPRRELIFAVKRTDDVAEVEAKIEATAPISYRGLVRQEYAVTDEGAGIWKANVVYGKRTVQAPKFTFDTGDGTKHITQSLETVNRYAPPGQEAPDMRGAINVDDTGVKGVDVPDGVFAFTETHYLPLTSVTPAYITKVRRLRGKYNDAPWTSTPFYSGGQGMTFAAGECRFRKLTGSKLNDEYFELTFHFEGSENAENLTIGNITGIDKLGWHYLWVRYGNAVDKATRVKRPAAVYVEKVTDAGNFNDLLLGQVIAIVLTNAGKGYLTAPAVTIGPPGTGGTQASATATINALGEVTGVTITSPGSGYLETPSVSFGGAPGGNSAAGIAILG